MMTSEEIWKILRVEAEYESFGDALSDSLFSVEGRKRSNLASEGAEWRQAILNLPLIYYLLSWFILFGYWPMLLGSEAKSSHYKL